MKLKLIALLLIGYCANLCAQTQYDIIGAGVGKGGDYFVKVTAVVKKAKDAEDALRRCAVDGVIFKGFSAGTDGGTNQDPIISDPNVKDTKADFFTAFYNEKKYDTFVNMEKTSFTSAKTKKGYEVSALLTVRQQALRQYLEDKGVINGFSNLW